MQYTIDLARSYHNLLQKEEDGNIQTCMWDENVAGMAQPFDCTGYQSDRTAGTYFAQAGSTRLK